MPQLAILFFLQLSCTSFNPHAQEFPETLCATCFCQLPSTMPEFYSRRAVTSKIYSPIRWGMEHYFCLSRTCR
ncbi:hypothetical protein B0H19DRAFT_1112081 [Mycena capillaripes]|nr:hypothetical protein B0H19DRAFT_1112081 [Mycena capillaripes]